MNGTVFSIEEFSVYDGPGIRTSVFLKGCPLRCTWCHNPEGRLRETEIVRSPNGCIGCGMCERTAVNGKFTAESIKKCPKNLLRYCGKEYTAEDLCNMLLKNERILNNGGGVTFSGGEPLLQSGFVFECLEILKGRLHTAIQTCGYCKSVIFENAVQKADFFLYDLKIFDDEMHKKYTGVSNETILDNFKILAKGNKPFIARIPLIPTVTDTERNISEIAEFLAENGVNYAEVLPYNKMAGGKYKMVLKEYKPNFDETAEVKIREEIFNSFNINIKVL